MDKTYLEYPKRRYGQDHDFYDWKMAKDRPKLQWKNGAKVAICFIVPLEFFPLNPSGKPFKHPGAMKTPYPDLRHFTVRDYGNRVGVFRILEAFNQANVVAGFAANGEIARRYPPLIELITKHKHEIIAHGLSTEALHHEGLNETEELGLVKKTLDCFDSPPKGWLSPARNQSSRTVPSLAKSKLSYCLDWEINQSPQMAGTGNGKISLLPNSYELSDFTLLHSRGQTEESWLKQIKSAIDLLVEEHHRFGSQMLGLTLTPYVIGQPFRIWALQALLAHIKDTDGVEVFTAGQIDQQFRAQI